MAAVAKNVTLSFGLLSCNVTVTSAIEPKPTNKNVCTGTNGHAEHPPVPLAQKLHCPLCGEVPYQGVRKAREVAGGLVLLEAAEMAAAKGDPSALKKRAAMTPHPSSQVELETMTSGKVYHLAPEPGGEVTYTVLRDLLDAHPELAFVCQWTPRSSAGLYQVRVHNQVLVFQERVRPGALREAPVLVAPVMPTGLAGMAEMFLNLPDVVTPFQADTYVDTYEANLAALIAPKVVSAMPAAPKLTVVPTHPSDAMAALEAMLAQHAA